jgi:hypothetical protein
MQFLDIPDGGCKLLEVNGSVLVAVILGNKFLHQRKVAPVLLTVTA